jgi:putative transposase
MNKYLEKIVPDVSDTWRTDELYLKIKGDQKSLYALMDYQTRFWIAQQVADTKYNQNVRPMFEEGKRIACKLPSELVSDGATNFDVAWKKEYAQAPKTKHTRHVHLQGDRNNDKMERMNGEIMDKKSHERDKEKGHANSARLPTPSQLLQNT